MHPWNISFESLDWSLTNFFHPSFATTQPRPQGAFPWLSGKSAQGTKLNPTLILIEMLIWNEKDNVKFSYFPVQGQSFRFRKLCEAPKQTTSSLDWSAADREVSLEPFIPAVRAFCKPYSYNWFLSYVRPRLFFSGINGPIVTNLRWHKTREKDVSGPDWFTSYQSHYPYITMALTEVFENTLNNVNSLKFYCQNWVESTEEMATFGDYPGDSIL